MNLLLFNFFTLKAIKFRILNNKISVFSLFDKYTNISRFSKINRFAILRNSIIGDFSFIGPSCSILNTTIGKYCSVSSNVKIGAPIHPKSFLSSSPIFYRQHNGTGSSWVNDYYFDDSSKGIIIGHDVWVGMNASIMGGINIGSGAIIGAHALVTKDVPPYAIVGGVPAKIIKYRFDKQIIEKLLELKWWDLSEEYLKENINLFQRENFILEELNNLKM